MNNLFFQRKRAILPSLFFLSLVALLFLPVVSSSEFGLGGRNDALGLKNFYINNTYISLVGGNGTFVQIAGDNMTGNLNMNTNNLLGVNYLYFNVSSCSSVASTVEGGLCWNPEKHVLNMVTGLGNVVQLSQETSIIATNKAGRTVFEGQVVSISNSSGNVPHLYLASANATSPVLHNLAMVTIPSCNNNAECVTTTWGEVHDLDTSGFAEGTELFLSADGSGNVTSTKPVFPNYRMHVGTVLRSHASEGVILFKEETDLDDGVTISDLGIVNNLHIDGNLSVKRPYGVFSSTQTQTLALANTPYPITFNWTEDTWQVFKSSDNSNFSFGQSGDYLIEISAIMQSGVTNKRVQIWFQKNGVNIPRSNTVYDFKGVGTSAVIVVPFIIDMNTSDKFRIMWAGDDTGITMNYFTNTSYSPETPSIIMTMTKISEITTA